MIFAPDNEADPKFCGPDPDRVSRLVIDNNIVCSLASIKIEKPKIFLNTPDLLYALRMYLTGDAGASGIGITSVSDD